MDEAHGSADEQSLIVQSLFRSTVLVDDQRLIAHFELIEVNVGHTQLVHARIAVDERRICLGFVAKLPQRDILLLHELSVELLGIERVEPDECCLVLVADDLSETAAAGLQHHVGGTGSFLWQYHAGETLAVPSLLTDLYEQDDFDMRE